MLLEGRRLLKVIYFTFREQNLGSREVSPSLKPGSCRQLPVLRQIIS